MELKGIDAMRSLLDAKSGRVALWYAHYEQKTGLRAPAIPIPSAFTAIHVRLGWCAKAVDALADRIVFREFRDDMLDINAIYRMNNRDVLFRSAILSALISSCCFIYISADETGYPKMQVIDGGRATGVIDPITGMLREGYAVLEKDAMTGDKLLEAYFEPGKTTFYPKGSRPYSREYDSDWPLLVPIVNRPDEKRPFGHSRISRACMSIAEEAMQTMRLMQICAEFYAFPQKYILGLSSDAERLDAWKATVTSMLTIGKDEDGDKPTAGQFQQASMAPYVEQLRACAALFAGETGLTTDDLGFVSDNPSSAEAIKAAHDNLGLTALAAQRSFGVGFLNAGYLAACVRDGTRYDRRAVSGTAAVWEPIFTPDMSTLSIVGDSAIKINQAVPGFMTAETLSELTGLRSGT